MRYYPENALEAIEFDKILEHLSAYTPVPLVKEHIQSLKPMSHREEIMLALAQTHEYLQLLLDGEVFPNTHFRSLKQAITALDNEYGVLNEEHFIDIRQQAQQIVDIIHFLEDRAKTYPRLFDLVYGMDAPYDLINLIDSVFDKKGVIKSSASKKLAELRKELEKLRKEVNRRFDRVLTKMRASGYLRDFEESFYHGRRVLAVTSEYKRIVKGKIQGTSETQSTTFIEPSTNILLNEEIDDLIDEEKREIFKILKQLTRQISKYTYAIKLNQETLARFEFTRAKAQMAKQLKASRPGLNMDKPMQLKDAAHPLLLILAQQQSGKKVVPLNLKLSAEKRLIVISGPNAGGKSIALKTTGLQQVMLQAGMLIPAHADSNFHLFDEVLVDLGDTQSIEYELSTYSSRLAKMKYFVKQASDRSLILMDEFGTGSDPDLGGAIAEVVLERLAGTGALGVITTHYNNIKLLADSHPSLSNACMLFNSENLTPKYELKMGQAGSSYTFEVAQIVGLQPEIISEARNRAQSQKLDYDKILIEYQRKLDEVKANEAELQQREKAFDVLTELTESRRNELENRLKEDKADAVERNKLMNRGRFLDELLKDYEQHKDQKLLMEKLLKKFNAEKIKQLEEQKSLKQKQQLAKQKQRKQQQAIDRKKPIKIPVAGDKVRMIAGGREVGVVDKIEKEKAHVTFGFIKSIVELSRIRVVD